MPDVPRAALPIRVDAAPRPNILVLLADDAGYSDFASFGATNVSTPHIDALVHSGVQFTQWISAASICTPSRAALQTGRYPLRTGCTGVEEARRVIPTPSNPGGLDPAQHMSLATALQSAGYRTGMAGKWHLGINHNDQDRRFSPVRHGYQTYIGAPYTNAPMCAMDGDGFSRKVAAGPASCFMFANDTVVEQPLALENFTRAITTHATHFVRTQTAAVPWYFFMAYFHVHTPLFTQRHNRGRSRGGAFGDNVEELDDSVGAIMATVSEMGFANRTLTILTSDNGPYQEEGWDRSGRTNLFDALTHERIGRLRGGKAQLYEGGVRMPAAVLWPGITPAGGAVSHTLVSTLDIFPTALAAAGVRLPATYVVDGHSMLPVLRAPQSAATQWDVFLHFCGFRITGARVAGRWKVFWATQRWYTFDPPDFAICVQCCNGVNRAGRVVAHVNASDLCGCGEADLISHEAAPIVYDMLTDPGETAALTNATWPVHAGIAYATVVERAAARRRAMEAEVHPRPSLGGGGTCTSGLPSPARQPCCEGCHAVGLLSLRCVRDDDEHAECSCQRAGLAMGLAESGS